MEAPKPSLPHKAIPKPTPDPIPAGGNDDVNVEACVTAHDEYEYGGKTATQIEDDVKGLFKGATVNHEIERNEGDDIVPKFAEDFMLLPHQVQARRWMKERETGRSHGGILADDMGSVSLPTFLYGELNSVPGSVKPFKPLSESSKESPTPVTRDEGTSRQLCKSHPHFAMLLELIGKPGSSLPPR